MWIIVRAGLGPALATLLLPIAVLVAHSTPYHSPAPAGWAPVEGRAIISEPQVYKMLPAVAWGGQEPAPEVQLASLPPEPVRLPVAEPEPPRRIMAAVDAYLCEVYGRTPRKVDNAGDFTWKDPSAAKRRQMELCDYVIRGMNRDLREALAAAGQAMDAKGIRWSILSAFRDDYRQTIATGIKARTGNSMHGGSRVTGGHGDGRAVDLIANPVAPLFRFIDQLGSKFGLSRPYRGFDPNHVQVAGDWQRIAAALRLQRAGPQANVLVAQQEPVFKKGVDKLTEKRKYAGKHKGKRYAGHRVKKRYAKRGHRRA